MQWKNDFGGEDISRISEARALVPAEYSGGIANPILSIQHQNDDRSENMIFIVYFINSILHQGP